VPRATVDIDLVVGQEGLEAARGAAEELGYVMKAGSMAFAQGRVQIHRVSKPDPDSQDFLSLDMLVVSPDLSGIGRERRCVDWEGLPLWVVSREGLIRLKELRGSGQDQDDIRLLRGGAEDEGS
jgi:hypothetical protein